MLNMINWRVEIIWKIKIWKIICKMEFGKLLLIFFPFKIKDEAMRRKDTWPQKGPCIGGHAVRLDAWIVIRPDNDVMGPCSPLGSRSNNDLDHDTKGTLSEENMPHNWVNVIPNRLTSGDQIPNKLMTGPFKLHHFDWKVLVSPLHKTTIEGINLLCGKETLPVWCFSLKKKESLTWLSMQVQHQSHFKSKPSSAFDRSCMGNE